MLTLFHLPLGHEIVQPKNRLERLAAMHNKFTGPKWFAAHNTLSEILNKQIPQEVSDYQYGLGSDELKKGIKQFKKKHPNFPCGI